MNTFRDLGVSTRLVENLAKQGIFGPNEVQQKAIPHLLQGGDAVLQAPTGSGKTLGFALPLIEKLAAHKSQNPRALVLEPTRELAAQVAAVLTSLGESLKVAVLYGGIGYGAQEKALLAGVDIIVACPGRLLDLQTKGSLSLESIEYLVLDEVDEMLDTGFGPSVARITDMCSKKRKPQTVLASATMPPWAQKAIEKYLVNPLHVKIQMPEEVALTHGVLGVTQDTRFDALLLILQTLAQSGTIVFTRTKHGARKLARQLAAKEIQVAELQGNMSQNQRDAAISAFRRQKVAVLVATNVAARGLDVSHVELVVNYELPDSPELMRHRIGRTARNGNVGKAVTFVTPEEKRALLKVSVAFKEALPVLDSEALFSTGKWSYITGNPSSRTGAKPRRGHSASIRLPGEKFGKSSNRAPSWHSTKTAVGAR